MKNRTSDDRCVLAERTQLKRLYWETPTEIRRVVTSRASKYLPTALDDRKFFYTIGYRYLEEYGTPELRAASSPIIVARQTFGYDSPGQDWIALNPAIALGLGWKLAKEGLFRWTDEDGNIMVESIWWVDGPLGYPPPRFDDEVGEGWLVLASESALEQIAAKCGSIRRLIAVEREYQPRRGETVHREGHASEELGR